MDVELEKLKKLEHALHDAIDILRDWQVEEAKPEEYKWIAYLARQGDEHCYLTACTEDNWEDIQKNRNVKTKLFIGSESEVEEWYESRQKFVEVIKAWEDGKTIQCRKPSNRHIGWIGTPNPNWDIDLEYRVKPEDKVTPTWSNIESCKRCVHAVKSAMQEPCNKCFKRSMFERKEKKYRPYENSAEMIADFIDRFKVNCPSYCEPLVWVKDKATDARHLVTSFVPDSDNNDSYVVLFECTCSFDELFKDYTYLDGSTVGMEVKE